MNINIADRKSFISRFLSPINKLSDNITLKVKSNKITSITSSPDNTCIIYSVFQQPNDEVDDTITLNIPDVSRFIKVLTCIDSDDIDLLYDNNNLQYKSSSVRFTYHLLEDGIISVPAISIEKVKQLEFDLDFEIPRSEIISLIRGSTFTTESNKIYFYTKDGGVVCELTDKERQNVDSFSIKVADSFRSESGVDMTKPLAMNFEILRAISAIQFVELKVHVNIDKNVFLFDIDLDNININIIASGYIQ
jgi:hypothetical protein